MSTRFDSCPITNLRKAEEQILPASGRNGRPLKLFNNSVEKFVEKALGKVPNVRTLNKF